MFLKIHPIITAQSQRTWEFLVSLDFNIAIIKIYIKLLALAEIAEKQRS